ncbi:hypothetical protein IRZ48_12860 [Pseudomonas fulva]|uniref:hypothetical protein n=1 Tax=Pseudomonas fulva TaxID=47880 RepID=UPI0018AC61E1|nr:hypothetical protein [Pseudomonas fulva]MBF8637510.1 hypothetical protein [Pseudomonas fulva]MBF8689495.1 hypothetical protein [Pseudomonas fulva]
MITIRTNPLIRSSEELRFSVDSPKTMQLHSQAGVFIKVRGWVLGRDGTAPNIIFDNTEKTLVSPSIARPDVAMIHSSKSTNCGFEFYVELGRNLKIGAVVDTAPVWFAEISFDSFGVLKGSDDYLFLDNDTNKSLSQYKGELLIDSDNLANWERYFHRLESEEGVIYGKSLFLIAPGKEYIFPDKYPVVRQGLSTLDQFLCTFNKNYIVNPIKELFAERNYTYSKVDTHWTHFGAKVAAEIVCDKLGIEFAQPVSTYSFSEISGDLGSKLLPVQVERIPQVDLPHVEACRIFDNRIGNRGRIHVYHNPAALSPKTCVIFGDSFSTTLAPQLVGNFQRLVHVFSGADIDWRILKHEKPDFVVTEITTRFLIKAPYKDFEIESELTRKYSAMSKVKRDSEHIKLLAYTDPSVEFYKQTCLTALHS